MSVRHRAEEAEGNNCQEHLNLMAEMSPWWIHGLTGTVSCGLSLTADYSRTVPDSFWETDKGEDTFQISYTITFKKIAHFNTDFSPNPGPDPNSFQDSDSSELVCGHERGICITLTKQHALYCFPLAVCSLSKQRKMLMLAFSPRPSTVADNPQGSSKTLFKILIIFM